MLTPAVTQDRVAAPADGLLRLSVVCPGCGKRPLLRITPEAKDRWQGADPKTLVQTYMCHTLERKETGHQCGAVVRITARAFQEAR